METSPSSSSSKTSSVNWSFTTLQEEMVTNTKPEFSDANNILLHVGFSDLPQSSLLKTEVNEDDNGICKHSNDLQISKSLTFGMNTGERQDEQFQDLLQSRVMKTQVGHSVDGDSNDFPQSISKQVELSSPHKKFRNLPQNTSSKTEVGQDDKSKCDICDKVLRIEEKQLHAKKHSGDYTCDTCGLLFTTFNNLSAHFETHTGVKRFLCDDCGQSFSHKKTLVTHKRTHTGLKPFICEECGHAFAQFSSLRKHKVIHTGNRPYVCDICHKDFSRRDTLREHSKIHTGEPTRKYVVKKEYKCSLCGHLSKKSGHLKLHMRIHTGERPFVCGECGKRFSSNSDLKKHLNVHFKKK